MMRGLMAALAGAALVTIALPAAATAAVGIGSTASGLAVTSGLAATTGSTPSINPKKAVCRHVSGAAGITGHCVGAQRIPLKDLTAAQWAERSKDLARIRARSVAPGHASRAAQSALTAPAQCQFSGTEFAQTGVSYPDRFTSCSDTVWWVYNYETTSTPPYIIFTGFFFWEDQQWNNYSATSPGWTHGMQTFGYTQGASGTLAGGFSGEVYSGCFLAQGICTAASLTTPDPQPVTIVPGGIYDFGWDESDAGLSASQPGEENILDTYLGVTWLINSTDSAVVAVDQGTLAGRCDSVATSTDGCVDEDFTPTVVYDATINPLVQPVALHIYDAQATLSIAWGVPSYIDSNGQVLTRDTNQADITANNRAACAGVVLQAGQNCDEFPLASTYEGAAFQGVFSAVAVPSSANSSQGGITSAFYASNRVVDSDPFYVLAILQNGAVSW